MPGCAKGFACVAGWICVSSFLCVAWQHEANIVEVGIQPQAEKEPITLSTYWYVPHKEISENQICSPKVTQLVCSSGFRVGCTGIYVSNVYGMLFISSFRSFCFSKQMEDSAERTWICARPGAGRECCSGGFVCLQCMSAGTCLHWDSWWGRHFIQVERTVFCGPGNISPRDSPFHKWQCRLDMTRSLTWAPHYCPALKPKGMKPLPARRACMLCDLQVHCSPLSSFIAPRPGRLELPSPSEWGCFFPAYEYGKLIFPVE